MNRSVHHPAHRLPLWLGSALLVLVALPATAQQFYQWKDEKGVTHYTDAPPPGRAHKSRSLDMKPASPTAAPKPLANADCTNARSNLKLLQGDGPVAIDENKDGKPDRQLTKDERTARTELAEAQIKTYCGAALAKEPA